MPEERLPPKTRSQSGESHYQNSSLGYVAARGCGHHFVIIATGGQTQRGQHGGHIKRRQMANNAGLQTDRQHVSKTKLRISGRIIRICFVRVTRNSGRGRRMLEPAQSIQAPICCDASDRLLLVCGIKFIARLTRRLPIAHVVTTTPEDDASLPSGINASGSTCGVVRVVTYQGNIQLKRDPPAATVNCEHAAFGRGKLPPLDHAQTAKTHWN